jgi:hypothetical protein
VNSAERGKQEILASLERPSFLKKSRKVLRVRQSPEFRSLPELLKSLMPTATRTVEFVAGISDPDAELSRKLPMRG